MHYINLSGYKFIKLNDLEKIQHELLTTCQHLGLKGTILLSTEGINLFVCVKSETLAPFGACIHAIVGPLEFKESPSVEMPFKKMLVKIKPEIITFGIEGIDPENAPAPTISAQEFKSWLDTGKEVIVFDTRNDYEVRIGTFKNAIHLNIQHFRQFPEAIKKLPEAYKDKPVVTFCTGGIRCEKAAPFLLQQGFNKVYQLEGGILKYLEENGHAHYDGECFVFDKRIAVDAALQESGTVQCHGCRQPVTYEEQQKPAFVAGESCPHCAK
ncbi:MAG TPA: rhodanese-like domain-containing protein [Candidatus Berkiella sp.]|nr:rhodanese-like domain-containing protein [Candidatus Berkiella sp.]